MSNKCVRSFARFACQSKANGDCIHAKLDRGGCVHVRWGGSLLGHLCDSPEAQQEAKATWLRGEIAEAEKRLAAMREDLAALAAEARATQAERERDEAIDRLETEPKRGAEAEELRAGIERIIEARQMTMPDDDDLLQELLDDVDARDSLAYLEKLDAVKKERDRAREALARVKRADDVDSLETELALLETEIKYLEEVDGGDLMEWLRELRDVRIAARRCLGEEPNTDKETT